MERIQQKRSLGREKLYHGCEAKIKNYSDSKSATNLISTRRTIGEGNLQVRNRVRSSKVLSDSSSCSSRSTEEDPVVHDLRQDCSKQASGTPMKKLLAEELSKEMESKRRPPSVIARLMGLDTLPPQQPIHKQQKKFSKDYLQRTASIGLLEKATSYEGRSFRMCKKEQQDFKDVFEVLETSKEVKHNNFFVQKEMENAKLSETKMDFIRQKFMDVKRLSTDQKLQQSKEFYDALEVLDSNKDLLLKFLQEPDSLFTKHLYDLQDVPPLPQSAHITVLKSSDAQNLENRDICWKSERKTEWNDGIGVVGHSHNEPSVQISSKVSKSQLQERDESHILPTRIVILKSNLRKAESRARPVSSPSSSGSIHSSNRKHNDYQSSENMELFAEVRERRNSSIELELVRHRMRGSRDVAKEITRQMRHSVNSGPKRVLSSRLRGYSGDESSYTTSENDSANESDVMTPTSRHCYDRKSRYSPSSSYSVESSVSREAKKRLSERWKMTQRFQEVRAVGRGSTLGEMLAMPDSETRSMTLDSKVGQDGFSDRLARKDGVQRWGSPLGISSRDGWRDECFRSLPRSRSLPASCTVYGSTKASIRHGTLGSDRRSMRKKTVNWGSSKSEKGYSDQIESFSPRSNIRMRSTKSQFFERVDGEKKHILQENYLKPGKSSMCLEERDLSEHKPATLELLSDDDLEEAIQATDGIAFAKPENAKISFEAPEEQLPEAKARITLVKDGGSSACYLDHSIPEITSIGLPEERSLPSHCTVTEVESPPSSKEAEQPSPVSVLEPPFVEDLSSGCNSFESVSADLQGLRMQLQLLKLESSDAFSEGFEMIISSDEDVGEECLGLLKDKDEVVGVFRDEEKRDFYYLVDVLVDSGFNDFDQDMLLAKWYSPECPVGSPVFEMLEKKYGEQTTWLKSERKLLFDRINLGLMELLRPHMDSHPWVKPVRGFGHWWSKKPLKDELWKLVVSQGKEAREDPQVVLGKEMGWLDLGDDIDAVGSGIEKLLIDELVAEFESLQTV